MPSVKGVVRAALTAALAAPLGSAGAGSAVARAPGRSPEAEAWRLAVPDTTLELDLVRLPAGAAGDEGPPVASFSILRTEVTWDLYDVYLLRLDLPAEQRGDDVDAEARPSKPYGAPDFGFGHAGYPVLCVTRHAAEQFCAWLSAKTGRSFRLPTEAEWRYACGDLDPETTSLEDVAWTFQNARGRTHPVGSLAPNRWGLHDMLGNAAEWCAGDELVVRGGSWRDFPEDVSPDYREVQSRSWNITDPQIPKSTWWLSDGSFVGFRVVCDDPPTASPR